MKAQREDTTDVHAVPLFSWIDGFATAIARHAIADADLPRIMGRRRQTTAPGLLDGLVETSLLWHARVALPRKLGRRPNVVADVVEAQGRDSGAVELLDWPD